MNGRFSATSLAAETRARNDMVDVTRQVEDIVRRADVENGLCVVFVPHTTAGVTINEHADPDVCTDILSALERIVPWHGDFLHAEGNSVAHVKASMMGSSASIIVADGRLELGTWQGVFLCEFDGPRTRQIWVSVLADAPIVP
jgi:secondary thiamine-phosphate synthase enzyme